MCYPIMFSVFQISVKMFGAKKRRGWGLLLASNNQTPRLIYLGIKKLEKVVS